METKINYNTFGTKHSRDYYRGASFHYSGQWVVGAHYLSDDYNIDYIVNEQVLLACSKSHLSTLENEPKDFIRDDSGTVIGIVSEYWDFVLSGINGVSPGIRINQENYHWEICDNISLPEEKQIWVDTGVKSKFEFSDLTEEEKQELIQPALDADVFEEGSGTNSVQQKGTGAYARSNSSAAFGQSTAQNKYAFAEGLTNTANGESSHVEGNNNNTGGTAKSAHAEGSNTFARGTSSHTEGYGTVTYNLSEHAEGMFNVSNKESDTYGGAGNTQHSVGIGASDVHKKNAFEIMQNGDIYVVGLGGYDGTNAAQSGVMTLQQILSGIETLLSQI